MRKQVKSSNEAFWEWVIIRYIHVVKQFLKKAKVLWKTAIMILKI